MWPKRIARTVLVQCSVGEREHRQQNLELGQSRSRMLADSGSLLGYHTRVGV